jgi:serine/threonine-protein kinase
MSVGGDDDTIAGSEPTTTTTGTGLSESELIAGRYRIVRYIGGGGMGRVYEVIDTELDEHVALKVLMRGLTDEAIERFRREVKLTRRILHRNVARMFDIGEHGEDKFLTMELVVGEPLGRLVGAEPMTWPKLKAIAEQICAGLAAAHAAGVVHRDLKPDNVLLERATGRVVLTDFGIARGGERDGSVTEVGAVVGTPRYMAPEQLAGKDVDARADLFSLGVMLFELATGTRPWPGDNAVAIAIAQATSAPGSIDTTSSHVPPAFASIVAACLRLAPEQRPATAELVGQAIASGDADLVARPGRPTKPPQPRSERAPATAAAIEPTSIAVLPFPCAPGDEYLADGLLEDITDSLSTTPGLRVRPAGVVRTQASQDPREVGQKLDVDHVVAGTLRRTPTGLRLNARLIGVAEGFQVWAHKVDFPEAEILAIGERLVESIAAALSARAKTGATRPTDPRAVELYLRARAEQRRFWAPHQQAASDLLEQAADIAPNSPQILGALAHATVAAWVLKGQHEGLDRARTNLARGLATGHGDAYLASAQLHFNLGEFERGGRDLGIALVRAPMSAQAHELAGNILVEVDSPVAARAHFETAMGLDPGRALVIHNLLARLDALEGKFESVDRRIGLLLADADPSIVQMGRVQQARMAGWRGDFETVAQASKRISPRIGGGAESISTLVERAMNEGKVDTKSWAQQWGPGGPETPCRQQLMGMQIVTEILLLLHRHDAAFDTLDAAAKVGLMDIVWLQSCPLFLGLAGARRLQSVREVVAERASTVLAAFRAAGG